MLIGISGKKNSGKDTVAELVKKHALKSEWEIKRFADPLKDMVCLLLGCTREQLEDREYKEALLGEPWDYWFEQNVGPFGNTTFYGSLTPREIMQKMGTEVGRSIHENAWVNALFNKYTNQWWIIPDTRFPNEAEAIKNRGGKLIRVNRNQFVIVDTHPSETSLDDYTDWDFVIDNNGTMEELEEKVIEICKQLI